MQKRVYLLFFIFLANQFVTQLAQVPAGIPAKPLVSVQQVPNDTASYDVIWTIYYGNKATNWQVFENNNLIYSDAVSPTDIPTPQTASYRISNKTFGAFVYKVIVSNAYGQAVSDPVMYTVGGASKIIITPADDQQQLLSIPVLLGTNNFTVSMFGLPNATFSISTNNQAVINPTITGNTLTINALKTGRASLCIKENSTGETRYVGIRVKNPDGTLPKLPTGIALGSVSENTASDLSFWRSFNSGLLNRWVDIRYIYINGGPKNGWRTWSNVDGGRAINYIIDSKKLGFIPFFVYYNIPDTDESYEVDRGHVQDQNYMEAYYKDLKFFLDIVRNQGGDEMVGIILEPDFLGYMMQKSHSPASQIVASTSAAYSSGVLNTTTDPVFPNTITGFVQSVNYMISKYAPNAVFGWQFNLWASPGVTTGVPANGLMHKTDTDGIINGRGAIAAEAQAIAQYYLDAGITSYGAHFISIDKYGLDAGATSPLSPSRSPWFWHSDHWNNYLLFSKTLHQTTNLPVILWQLPVGRINTSDFKNPYNATDANNIFPVLDNSNQHYEDSAPVFFLGDTFRPGVRTPRYNYFATNQGADPKLSTTSNSVTWQQHMTETQDSGVVAVLFGAGVASSTNSTGTLPSDSYWWITKAQEYFARVVR